MPRDYKLYLEDILEAIDKIERYLEGISFEEFSTYTGGFSSSWSSSAILRWMNSRGLSV